MIVVFLEIKTGLHSVDTRCMSCVVFPNGTEHNLSGAEVPGVLDLTVEYFPYIEDVSYYYCSDRISCFNLVSNYWNYRLSAED